MKKREESKEKINKCKKREKYLQKMLDRMKRIRYSMFTACDKAAAEKEK